MDDKKAQLRELLENATREELYKTIYQLMGAVTALKIALAKTEAQIRALTKGMESHDNERDTDRD